MQSTSQADRRDKLPAPPPQCKTILLCEHRIVEAETRRVTLVNIFNTCHVEVYPTHIRPATLFVKLIGGLGHYELQTQVLDLREDKVIADSPPMSVRFPDKLGFVDVTVGIPSLPIEHPGLYDIVLLANGQEIDRIQFDVRPPPGTKPPQVPQGPVDEML